MISMDETFDSENKGQGSSLGSENVRDYLVIGLGGVGGGHEEDDDGGELRARSRKKLHR